MNGCHRNEFSGTFYKNQSYTCTAETVKGIIQKHDSGLQSQTNIYSSEVIIQQSVGLETRIKTVSPKIMVPTVSLPGRSCCY